MNTIGYIDETVNTITGCQPDYPCWGKCWARKRAQERLCKNPKLSALARSRYKSFKPAYWPERLPQLGKGKGKWIAVNFMGDFFAYGVREEAKDATFSAMIASQNTFLILTKRPIAMAAYMAIRENRFSATSYDNIYFGTSVSTQLDAEIRLPELMELQGLKRWVSIEPALEPITLKKWLPKLSWVVFGFGNWKDAPRNVSWFNDLSRECRDAGVPFWLKGKSVAREWQEKPGAQGCKSSP